MFNYPFNENESIFYLKSSHYQEYLKSPYDFFKFSYDESIMYLEIDDNYL